MRNYFLGGYKITYKNKRYYLIGYSMFNPIIENHVTCLYLVNDIIRSTEGEFLSWVNN